MAITLNHIAEKCCVSKVAVSQVLGNPNNPRFSKKTRKLILEVAQELGYTPNILARHLKGGNTHLICMVIPFNDPEVMDTVQRTAQELGHSLMVQFTPTPDIRAERAALRAALERRADGIIWQPASPGHIPKDIAGMLKSAGTKVVILQSPYKELPHVDVIRVDFEDACRKAVSHLISSGYTELVHVAHDLSYELRRYRAELFQKITGEMGVSSTVLAAADSETRAMIMNHIKTHKGKLGFYGQDFPSLDIIETAEKLGRSIPDDIGIVILGDLKIGGKYRVGELSRPKLTAIQIPADKIAETAVRTLIGRIKGTVVGAETAQVIPTKLITRQSTTCNK